VATEIPPHPDYKPYAAPAAEQEEPTRGDRIKAAFKEQRGNAGARLKDWLAAGDLDAVAAVQLATDKKLTKYDRQLAQQERITGEAVARVKHAQGMQGAEVGTPISESALASLVGRASQEESKLAALRARPVMPPNDREISAARQGKKAQRAAIVAGSGLASLPLAGVMGLWVAASGGGKTGILQALAEGVTACRDNITIDLDPFGDGLEDLGDAVRITARTNEQIEAVLLFFLVMAKGRARLRAKLGMGKKWKASPEHPAVTIFFDELPKASALAKRLYNDLLLVGRKELIVVEAASQGGQSSYLGANIAQMVALAAVGPCKVEDTRSVFGDGSVKEGYLPHRLSPATATDPKDAGHIFIQGVPGMADEPIEYAVHEVPSATLRQLGQERLDAGLLDPDQDSLNAMRGVDLPEYVEPEYDKDGNLKKPAPAELLTWEQLLRLCDAEPPAGAEPDGVMELISDAVDVMDKRGVDRMRTEVLAAALAEHDPDTHGGLDGEALKSALAETVGKPVQLGAWDGMSNPRGYRREDLAIRLRP
jgi:hypothetical protein